MVRRCAQRVDSDAKFRGNLLVKISGGEQRENFLLARREFVRLGSRLFNLVEMIVTHPKEAVPNLPQVFWFPILHRQRFSS